MDYEKAYKASLKTAAQWIKDGCTDKEKICLECVFPELRESEDERIRMKLFHTVRGTPKDNEWFEEISKEAMLAWLEKQKDSKVCEEKSKNFTIQTFEEKEYIRTLKSLISDFIRDKQPEDVTFYQKIYDWLDGRHIEQKHPNGCFTCDEYKKGYEEGRRNGFTAGYNKAMKEVEQKEQKPDIEICPHSVKSKSYSETGCPIEQKPMEWSEENETSIAVKNPEAYKIGFADGEAYAKEQMQEWSEEDEKMLAGTLNSLKRYQLSMPNYQVELQMRWLKSLRPSWKPTYEQVDALRKAVNKLADTEVADSVRLSIMYDHLKELV